MQFVWEMDESLYKNLMAVHNTTGTERLSIKADVYGSCKTGSLCADFQHLPYEDNWYAYTNVYALGVDNGYGETESGIPYTLLNDGPADGPAVPMDTKSFEEFKAQFERNFEEYICASEYTKSLANQPLGNWD